MNVHIYVVDDDENIRDIVAKYLVKEGYQVHTFDSIDQMHSETSIEPDVYVLDIMMPGESGLEFCNRLRVQSDIPVIFISARGDELDRIIGLELGADDYLSKPFSPRELVVRLKNILKRSQTGNSATKKSDMISFGNTRISKNQRTVTADQEIEITTKEFSMLVFLCENCNQVFSREQLLDQVWGYDYIGDIRAVDDLVKRLRKKLKEGNSDIEIQTVWGYGYKINGKIS